MQQEARRARCSEMHGGLAEEDKSASNLPALRVGPALRSSPTRQGQASLVPTPGAHSHDSPADTQPLFLRGAWL